MFHAIFLRASRLVFFFFWRFCSALLCFALLCWRRFIRRSSFQEEDGSHGPMAARCFPSLSRPICLVSAYLVRTKHARSCCSVSILGDFSAFFHQTRVVFVAFLGSRQKHSGFGLGVRRGDYFRLGVGEILSRPPNQPFYGGARRQRQRQRRR